MSDQHESSPPAPETAQGAGGDPLGQGGDDVASTDSLDAAVVAAALTDESGDSGHDPAAAGSPPIQPPRKVNPPDPDTLSETVYQVPAKTWTSGWEKGTTDPEFDLTLAQSVELLAATRKRAEGWRSGSASLVALIVASLALRSSSGWMSSFTDLQLYIISGLVAIALLLALGSMWFTLRAANGPHRLDTRVRDYNIPHDAKRFFKRSEAAAKDLKCGQRLLWVGVVVFSLASFASWLLDPQADSWWKLR